MSYWNKIAGLAVVGALVAAPSMADGRDRVVVQGPPPLQASAASACEFGRTADGTCALPTTMTLASRTYTTTQAPTVRRVVRQSPTVHRTHVSSQPKLDFSGFNGGVGANVATGFVSGGGGVVIVNSGARRQFSGVPGRAFAIARARGVCCH
ncbi:MAG: hypothetical protein AAFX86_15010 [Pseudomonadota bacterium]